MNQELKQIITGFLFFGVIIFISWLIFARDIKPDLGSVYYEQEGQYQDGGGGHPLWP